MSTVTIIGDVHGKYDKYLEIVRNKPSTIQIGDMGFNYDHMRSVDPLYHMIIGGNHDNYDELKKWGHYIGDFGRMGFFAPPKDLFEFFFVRGGLSIDKHIRIEGKSWWRDEEISLEYLNKAVENYSMVGMKKPNLMITHVPPQSIVPLITGSTRIYPSRTGQALDAMLYVHRPKVWIFGHMHTSFRLTIDGTKFISLDELETLDIGDNLDDV